MPGHTRLYRRGAVYYHRAAVPVDIIATYGKREETFSLKTKDPAEGCCQTDSNQSPQGQWCCPLFHAKLAPRSERGVTIALEGAGRLIRTSLSLDSDAAPYSAHRPRHSVRAAARFRLKFNLE